MYTLSFYSFKGGVGRSMALVNVGVWLAARGRRVLLVDFDLEAPGLTHFDLPQPQEPTKGVVDFVASYVETGSVPNIEGHFYPVTGVGEKGGELFVMPAGHPKDYQARFQSIRFDDLYSNRRGYLLMESLKEQWKSSIAPDYVLVDSRTGHTDIAGICTRQFPDAVVCLFYPSRQNILGLQEVVEDVRKQNEEGWRSQIKLHFVASNLPLFGSEDGTVDTAIATAKKTLGFDELAGRIRSYPSSAHIRQAVFVKEWTDSDLAREYRHLTERLIEDNAQDHDAVIRRLESYLSRRRAWPTAPAGPSLETYLSQAEQRHAAEADVLFTIARVRLRQGLVDEALVLLDKAIQQGGGWPEPLLLRANLLRQRDKKEAALLDVQAVLSSPQSDFFQTSQAAFLLAEVRPTALADLHRSVAFAKLEATSRATLAVDLARTVHSQSDVDPLIRSLADDATIASDQKDSLRNQLVLSAIGAGRFDEALSLLGPDPARSEDAASFFNYAIVRWAQTGRPQRDLFSLVVGKFQQKDPKIIADDPNHLQCYGLALAHTGQLDESRSALERAHKLALRSAREPFSCWTYEYVERAIFCEHIDAMLAALSDGSPIPPVVRRVLERTNAH